MNVDVSEGPRVEVCVTGDLANGGQMTIRRVGPFEVRPCRVCMGPSLHVFTKHVMTPVEVSVDGSAPAPGVIASRAASGRFCSIRCFEVGIRRGLA